ncbi:hypothetical protein TRVA0_017S00408 [Trichomonascus vanleenenianus]|uniref:uncharacterized protein n=1 Tax=Trichomonascus vanleenenianus TaxID=2268995 RepID=UPI003ECB44BA
MSSFADGTSGSPKSAAFEFPPHHLHPPPPNHPAATAVKEASSNTLSYRMGSYLQAETTEDKFPILVRRQSSSGPQSVGFRPAFQQQQQPHHASHGSFSSNGSVLEDGNAYDSNYYYPDYHSRRTASFSGVPLAGNGTNWSHYNNNNANNTSNGGHQYNHGIVTPRMSLTDGLVEEKSMGQVMGPKDMYGMASAAGEAIGDFIPTPPHTTTNHNSPGVYNPRTSYFQPQPTPPDVDKPLYPSHQHRQSISVPVTHNSRPPHHRASNSLSHLSFVQQHVPLSQLQPPQPSHIQPPSIQPSPIQPSHIQPSHIQPSHIQPSPLQPSHIQPVSSLTPLTSQPPSIVATAAGTPMGPTVPMVSAMAQPVTIPVSPKPKAVPQPINGNGRQKPRRQSGSKPSFSRRNSDQKDLANKFAQLDLESMVNDVYSLCKDQYGCRYLQKKLEEKNPRYLEIIFNETYPHVVELMTDPFGNYLCQKLLEHADTAQRALLVRTASPQLVKIALNQHGTRALQKMLEYVTTREQIDLIVAALQKDVVGLVKDLNGNHVIQKCLNRLSSEDCQFIFDAVSKNCVSVGTHRHGCCVLQRCIDHANEVQKRQLVGNITESAFDLVRDPFGNYVTQYVLDLGLEELSEPLIGKFQTHVCELSMQKFSSNVIEKCLRIGTPKTTTALIDEVIESPSLELMLRDSYANYVVQTAFDYATPSVRERLLERVRPLIPAIRSTPHGRKIQSKFSSA